MSSRPRGAAHLGDRPLGDDGPAVDDDDVVGQALGLLEGVGGHDDGAPGRAGLAHQVPHVEPGVRVQAGGRLVQEDHLGAARRGRRRAPPAAAGRRRAGGRSCRRTPRCPAGPPGRRRRRARRTGRRRAAAAGPARAPLGRPPSCSITPTRARRSAPARRVAAQHPDRPAVGALQPLAALDRGGLAGAVRAEHGGDLPGRGRPRHAVDRAMGAETAHELIARSRPGRTPRSLGRPPWVTTLTGPAGET